ncbi:MAG: hypothetical protein BalsKO_20100 [Balneolaceae bacterium]
MAKENPQHNVSSVKQLLSEAHLLFEKEKKLNIVLGGSTLFLIWIIAFILIEHIFYLLPATKITLLLFLFTGIISMIWVGLRRIKEQSFIDFYRVFARSADLVELSYALDLEKSTNANPKLIEAAIFKNLELVKPDLLKTKLSDFQSGSTISKQFSLKRLLSLGSLLLLFIIAFGFKSSTQRLANFWVSYEKPNPFNYVITPGNTTIEQGGAFSVSVTFNNDIPSEAVLMIKTTVEENYRSRSMNRVSNVFSSLPFDLNNDVSYYIEMDGYRSEIYKAQVQLLPRFTELSAIIIPPEYTSLDSVSYTYPFSQISAHQGSSLILEGISNKSLSNISLKQSKSDSTFTLDEQFAFVYSLNIRSKDTLSFRLEDINGLTNQNPFQFTIEPLSDEYPYVELLEPNTSFEAVDPSKIELLFRPSDDFGLRSATLNYELKKAFVENPITRKQSLSTPRNGVLQAFTWEISDLELKPKDELSFWIEVTDNDAYNGFKTTKSQVITLTVPSLIDYFEGISEQEDEVETDLEDISEAFEEMSEQYDTFKEQLKEDPETNYEQQRQLEEVQRQQEEIEERIEKLNEKFDEIKEELSENNMLSEETMAAYEELQELMKEIDDPAFRDALEKLQEQMSQMSPEQLRDALQEAEFNEELYKQRLERTLELFKQLKMNSELEKLAQTYDDLARQEEELENQAEEDSNKEEEQRESTLEQTEQLQKKIEELSENTTQKTEKSIEEYQKKSQEELERIKENLEELLKEMQKDSDNSDSQENKDGENSESQQQQQQNLKQDFEKLAEMTRQQMEQMNQQQMNVNIAGLQYILYSLLHLSVEQEDLVSYANTTENRSQAYIEFARDQKNVEGIFTSLSDSLFELSKEIPQFSNQINEKKEEVKLRLTSSLEQMSERNQSRASVATRQSLGGINEIAFMIANLLEQLQNSSDGSGGSGGGMNMQQMMEQMQQMGENQQQLNQQMQDMINDMQGERLTQDQMERLNQLSKQQNKIRQQLEQLQQNGELEGGDELGSQLERMIEEMEDTINDLRGGAIDPTLIERQQNILSRMLEAEQALQERDEEEKREGTTGVNPIRQTPPELTLEELEKQIRNRLNDPNFTKYSTDYQRLIEKYFELLRQIQEREIQ